MRAPCIRLALLLLLLAGCATGSAAGAGGSLVVLEPPEGHCRPLGRMSVRMSTELLMSQDALLASAVSELRRRAADRGATHLVLSPRTSPAMVSYGTTAAASGVAFRCPLER